MIRAIADHAAPFGAGVRIFSNEPEVVAVYRGDDAGRSLKSPWTGAFDRPADLYASAMTTPSVIALFHADDTPIGRQQDEALEHSGLFKRVGRFEAGCAFAPIPADRTASTRASAP
jgi:hypothetical protein